MTDLLTEILRVLVWLVGGTIAAVLIRLGWDVARGRFDEKGNPKW